MKLEDIPNEAIIVIGAAEKVLRLYDDGKPLAPSMLLLNDALADFERLYIEAKLKEEKT